MKDIYYSSLCYEIMNAGDVFFYPCHYISSWVDYLRVRRTDVANLFQKIVRRRNRNSLIHSETVFPTSFLLFLTFRFDNVLCTIF